jgi:hypothetical protein
MHGWSVQVLILTVVTQGLAGTSTVAAQPLSQREVVDASSCARCELRRATRLVFRSAKEEGEISELPLGVRTDPAGNYWVLAQKAAPRAYDSSGTFMKTLGRSGQGPGEFSMVEDIVWVPGDSVLVLDGINRRATVFAPDGRYVRHIRTPAQLGNAIVLRWPWQVLVSGHISASSTVGFPLHLASFSDEEVRLHRSFGPDRGLLRPGYRGTNWHLTARGPDGSIVTAKPEQFRLYEWDDAGSLRSTLIRRSTWFPDTGAARLGTPARPPSPGIAAIDVDDQGLIWVFIRVAAPTWQRAWARVPEGAREVFRGQLDYESLFNTRAEIIDPSSNELLATLEIPGLVVAALGNARVAVYGVGSTGEAALRVDAVRLIRPGRNQRAAVQLRPISAVTQHKGDRCED